MSRWTWDQRDEHLRLDTLPGAATSLTVWVDGHGFAMLTVELPEQAVSELVSELVSTYGHPIVDRADELEQALQATEEERDELRTALKALTGVERALRADLERMKSAGQLSDQLVRSLEAERDEALLRADQLEAEARRMLPAYLHDEIGRGTHHGPIPPGLADSDPELARNVAPDGPGR